VILVLIGINLLVFLANRVFYGLNLPVLMAMIPLAVRSGWVWQFVTYMFFHTELTHLIFNMLALFIFGVQVERQMGSREFLLYYLITGTLAGVFSFFVYWFTGADRVFLIGASGAVFAVQLAYAIFFPNAVLYIWGILPLRAPVMVLGFTALELFFQFTGFQRNVAHFTHLAGFAFGWLYFLIRLGINPWRYLRGR
jgi:membrane associated rhomboid family serine protease